MEKEFVPYEIALELSKLGFREQGFRYWTRDNMLNALCLETGIDRETAPNDAISAPTIQRVFGWLREKYGLYSWIQLHNGYINDSFYPELPITFSIMDRKTGNKYYERDIPHNYLYKTNEEAELECLRKLIEIVKEH